MARKKQATKNSQEQLRSDLTGYAALLGESFGARVELLERVIRGSHYPSLGRYKERLLAQLIRDYIPSRFEVGTGFVLFPHEDLSPPGGHNHHDPLNQSAFAISRQCDILVFDSTNVPPVFRDGDFVVVRPEAVSAVIEVKGALSLPETTSILDSFTDFGRKWRTTQLFYKRRHQKLSPAPELIAMAWSFQKRRDGRPVTKPPRVRDRIADYYKEHVQHGELRGFPILSHLFVYDECDIVRTIRSDEIDGTYKFQDGWCSTDGRFIRFASGKPKRDKDRTIAALLATLHYATSQEDFNRFFSYTDEIRETDLVPYEHYGFSTWLEPDENDELPNTSDMV